MAARIPENIVLGTSTEGQAIHPVKIYAFVAFYPSSYKPYLDSHFVDLVSRGIDLRVLALGCLDSVWSEKVREYGLDHITSYFYPDDLRSMPRFMPRLLARLGGVGEAVRISRGATSLKERVKSVARVLSLPATAPDVCLIHDQHALHLMPWLRQLYPTSRIGLFYYGGDPADASPLSFTATSRVFDAANVIFALTDFCRREAIERGAASDRILVHPLGFELGDFEMPSSRRYRPDGRLRLATAGRISLGKGHEDVLEALAVLKADGLGDFSYTIMGDGPRRAAVNQRVLDLGLVEEVRFTGAISNQALVRELAATDALILASFSIPTWTETQGAVVQEAMLMGNVVVTTKTGGVPESIPPFMRPYSVPPRNVAALAGAIRRVALMSAQELHSLGGRGRAWVAERYDVHHLNARVLETLAEGATLR